MSTNDPDFTTWQHETLSSFAKDAYRKLKEQDEEIQQLRIDLKDAIRSYRELVTKVIES